MTAAIAGGAAGPWAAGVSHDLTGRYASAFWACIACSGFSGVAIYRAFTGMMGRSVIAESIAQERQAEVAAVFDFEPVPIVVE
jgi:hypothetical protein